MKIPYVNCGWRKEYGSNARSYQHTKLVVKEKPEKNSGPYGIWTLDFCYTGAVLYQMNWQANWELENFDRNFIDIQASYHSLLYVV